MLVKTREIFSFFLPPTDSHPNAAAAAADRFLLLFSLAPIMTARPSAFVINAYANYALLRVQAGR